MNDTLYGHGDGFLTRNGGQRLFPIGFYEHPAEADALRDMAESGVNLVLCGSEEALDRAQAHGMMGWVPLGLQSGPTPEFQERIRSLAAHPALAVWEGPDEVVWGFTAYSGLWKQDQLAVFPNKGEWWMQTPLAIEYSEERAAEIMPKMRGAIEFIRSVDPHNRQIWINEARDSDLKFVRQYIDFVDITGCDDYPIRAESRPAIRVADATDRWRQVGKGRPVWMVLQGFTWSDLDDGDTDITAFPTFAESRLMVYACITHGARGILYWGSSYMKSEGKEGFRKSLYALTSELAALQPFLTAPVESYVTVNLIDDGRTDIAPPMSVRGVSITARRTGRDWLIVLVNEDEHPHMGVEVAGLDALNGTEFVELYGEEKTTVSDGSFSTRIRPLEVKLFATHRKWETDRREGRDFEK
ncbi:MAG: hypothetical protein OXI63_22460 [Candidatus Poribacteria bacterium]|nr:hypothetical protein [Candidatus Poribacteria bacterium]